MSRFSQGGSEGDLTPPASLDSGASIPGLSDTTESTISDVTMSVDALSPSSEQTAPDSSTAVLRVAQRADAYTPYLAARLLIQDGENPKVLGIVFDVAGDQQITPLNIPLVGQTINDLADDLNAFAGIVAEVLNDSGNLSSSLLLEQSSLDITNRWGYLYVGNENITDGSSLVEGLQYYLTSLEPGIPQNIPSQSVGGFISPTSVYPTETLEQSVSFYTRILPLSGDSLSSYTYLSINDEIIRVARWEDAIAHIEERNALGTPIRFHPRGSIVRGLSKNDVFTANFSEEHTQYRCIAIKNTATQVAHDVRIFFKLASRNNLSGVRMAIELPKSEFYSGSVTSGTTLSFVDSSLAGLYDDDHFVGCAVSITGGDFSGQIRIVTDYVGSTGEVVFDSALAGELVAGTTIEIDTAPAQRLRSGTKAPSFTNGSNPPFIISEFMDATYLSNGLDINVNESRENGSSLHPNDVIYVWIERELDDINDSFNNNRTILTVSFKGA